MQRLHWAVVFYTFGWVGNVFEMLCLLPPLRLLLLPVDQEVSFLQALSTAGATASWFLQLVTLHLSSFETSNSTACLLCQLPNLKALSFDIYDVSTKLSNSLTTTLTVGHTCTNIERN